MKRQLTSSILSLVLIISSSITLSGCSNYNKAQGVYTAVSIAVNLAQGELPLFVSTGIMSQQDETIAVNFVTLLGTFNDNYEACITNAQNTMLTTSGKFVDCLGVFARSLSDPTTLAGLRVMNPKAQGKVQAIIAAVVAGVNIGLNAFKAGQVATPVVTTVTADVQLDIDTFQAKVIDNLPANLKLAIQNGY